MKSNNFTEIPLHVFDCNFRASSSVGTPKPMRVSLIKEMDSLDVSIPIPDSTKIKILGVNNASRGNSKISDMAVDENVEFTRSKNYWWQNVTKKIDKNFSSPKCNNCTKIFCGWMIFLVIVFCVAFSVYQEWGN